MFGNTLPLVLQVSMIVVCLVFLIGTIYLVARGRLSLKYSLLWLLLSIVLLVFSVFPEVIVVLSYLFGFKTSANFVLSTGLFFLLAIAMMLSVTISWQAAHIRKLTQSVALLEHKLEERDNPAQPDPETEAPQDTQENAS